LNQENPFSLRRILLSPRITDKSYNITKKNNQVSFKVAYWANKKQIKQSIEYLFNVKISNIQTLNIKGKCHKFGRKKIKGYTKKWKKAYATLKKGYKINFIETE